MVSVSCQDLITQGRVGTDEVVSAFKACLCEGLGLDPNRATLVYDGRQLQEAKTVGEIQIRVGATLHLVPLRKGKSE